MKDCSHKQCVREHPREEKKQTNKLKVETPEETGFSFPATLQRNKSYRTNAASRQEPPAHRIRTNSRSSPTFVRNSAVTIFYELQYAFVCVSVFPSSHRQFPFERIWSGCSLPLERLIVKTRRMAVNRGSLRFRWKDPIIERTPLTNDFNLSP